MLKLAQRQGPKYDIGLFHKYVVSPRRFGIGSHRSDWDGGQARFFVFFFFLGGKAIHYICEHM